MSSTIFKSITALKTKINYGNWEDWNYILIAETAESNCYNYEGGHTYSRWIYACGSYLDILREVCKGSVDFESGMAKGFRGAAAFINQCKKALDNAEIAEKIPRDINCFVYYPLNVPYDNTIMELFADFPQVRKEKFLATTPYLTTDDIATYCNLKNEITNIIRYYQNDCVPNSEEHFRAWMQENQRHFRVFDQKQDKSAIPA